MNTEHSIEIDAPPSLVWAIYCDVERWSEWTRSIRSIEALDGADLEVGRRFRIRQPRLPALVWEVVAVEPGVSWTWRQRSPGGVTDAWHEVTPTADGGTLARLGVDQRGPVGAAIGLVMARLTRRYLELESRGLKARAEELHRREAPP